MREVPPDFFSRYVAEISSVFVLQQRTQTWESWKKDGQKSAAFWLGLFVWHLIHSSSLKGQRLQKLPSHLDLISLVFYQMQMKNRIVQVMLFALAPQRGLITERNSSGSSGRTPWRKKSNCEPKTGDPRVVPVIDFFTYTQG